MTGLLASNLAAALIKAQAEFQPIPKRGKNPFLKTEYATLDDLIGTIREPLHKHGLAFVQLLGTDETGAATLTTILFHESGESIECQARIGTLDKTQNALQALGGAITYMRRYSLAAMLGLATGEDTDGEGTEKVVKAKAPAPKSATPAEPKPAPAPANGHPQATNGGKPALAKSKSKRWTTAALELTKSTPYYLKDGHVDWFHLTGAAAKLGFAEITDQNLEQVLDALRTHAASKQAEPTGELDAAFPREEA